MDSAPREPARPLRGWRYPGTLRTYQAEVLDQLPALTGEPLHIVAPPGSGKTLLGLLLAARDGRRALALSPTVTIRQQWQGTAGELAERPNQVSVDPAALADFTALTYQLLSVVDPASSPFEELARVAWLDEMTGDGRQQPEAEAWLAELARANPGQFRTGIRRRSRRIRRRLVQQQPAELARVLHPNALALLEQIVSHGIEVIILDECHHLLDHWAFVVAYLVGRIRERGGSPQLIGLTATLPSPDDAEAYENYSQLLGEVDYEVPTPAVVKSGHLAPYADRVWFVEPTAPELAFIRKHEQRLHELIGELLAAPAGLDFLVAQLQPEDAAHPGRGAHPLDALDRALEQDFFLTRACGSVLREIAPTHPLSGRLSPALFSRCSTDDLLTVLSRYALTRLLTDPGAQQEWLRVKRALVDFGYHLTDRGIRRGRNPIETTLAGSAAKERGALEILRAELAGADAERIRAVVITDFTVHGNQRGLDGGAPAGALRCFETLATDPIAAALSPVLLTAQHLRVRGADAERLAAELGELLGGDVTRDAAEPTGAVVELRAAGAGSGRIVAAVSELVRRGSVRLIVGTRGLLGEGWDCPPVNTLIDLTAVATSSATQQLRGRTLRLDPAWPGKVAQNWSVACLIPAGVALDTPGEVDRLRRKHEHLWGLSAADRTAIVTGLEHALRPAERALLLRVLGKDRRASCAQINAGTLASLPSRAETHADWRVGEPYAGQEQEVVVLAESPKNPVVRGGLPLAAIILAFCSAAGAVLVRVLGGLRPDAGAGAGLLAAGLALALSAALFGPALLRELRHRARPDALTRGAAIAVARALREAGRIDTEFGAGNIVVRGAHEPAETTRRSSVEITGGTPADRRALADAVAELFGPVRSPRFLLRVDRGALGRWNAILAAPLAALDRLLPQRTLLAVPALIGRRRADAQRFQELWRAEVGACTLHELNDRRGLELLRRARADAGRIDRFAPRHRGWV